MAKKKESSKPTLSKRDTTNDTLPFYDDFFLDKYTMKRMPISITYLEKMAIDMPIWFKSHERAYKIVDYLVEKGILRDTYQRWCKRCPKLQAANDFCVQLLSGRREAGMIEKRFAEHSTMFAMPMYDEDWMNMHKFHAELRKKEEDKKQNITIVIPDIREKDNESDTDKLPDKTRSDPKVKQIQGT